MIAHVPPPATTASIYRDFLQALADEGFAGDISARYADRVVLSTDNSLYQRLPQAVVFPRHAADVALLARLAAQPPHRRIVLTPRGGGTGTNAQSLTDGIVVDLSRHMNRILHVDAAKRRVRVEAGVVKDQLNAALKPHGLFFAPELSTSNRATIGGMIATAVAPMARPAITCWRSTASCSAANASRARRWIRLNCTPGRHARTGSARYTAAQTALPEPRVP